MRKRAPTAPKGGPSCPKCGNIPYDIVKMEKQSKGPDMKVTIWYCPDVGCNPTGVIMRNDEVWSA